MAGNFVRRFAVEAVEVRTTATSVDLDGYASTFNQPYKVGWFNERVHPDAFRATLGRDPDVRLLINHADLPLARTKSGTMQLSTDAKGLRVQASLDPSDPDVQRIVPKMKRGDLNQMSFAFRVAKGGDEWSEDGSQRTLRNLELHDGDVSVVTYPANPNAIVGARGDGFPAEAIGSALLAFERRGASREEFTALLHQIQRAMTGPELDPVTLAKGTDAALDEAMRLLGDTDTSDLPANIAQAIDLMRSAWASAGAALKSAGADDPDDRSASIGAVTEDVVDAVVTAVSDPAPLGEERATVTDAAWDGAASRFTIEQWRASCLVDMGGNPESKANYKLPVREPDGTLNRNAVHAAAGRISQLDAPAPVIADAKKKLVALYGDLKEDVPDGLRGAHREDSRFAALHGYRAIARL